MIEQTRIGEGLDDKLNANTVQVATRDTNDGLGSIHGCILL
jgi:hypothetical protein